MGVVEQIQKRMFAASVAGLDQFQAFDGGLIEKHGIVNMVRGDGGDVAQGGLLSFLKGGLYLQLLI